MKLNKSFVMVLMVAGSIVSAQPGQDRVQKKSLENNPAYQSMFSASSAPAHVLKERTELPSVSKVERQATTADPSAVGDTPTINSGGVVNVFASTYVNRLAPGEFVSIYGLNYANFGQSAGPGNLPVSLNGAQVLVNGTPAALSYVGPGQINAQVPYGLPFGNNQVVVSINGRNSVPFLIQTSIVAPELYKYNGAVYTQNTNGQGVGTQSQPLMIVGGQTTASIHYASGLGLTSPFVSAGQVTYAASSCTNTMTVSASVPRVSVSYCGLSPGSIGLGQINLIWPGTTPAGTHTVQLNQAGVYIPPFQVTIARQ